VFGAPGIPGGAVAGTEPRDRFGVGHAGSVRRSPHFARASPFPAYQTQVATAPAGTFLPLPKLAIDPFLKLWEQEVCALLLAEGKTCLPAGRQVTEEVVAQYALLELASAFGGWWAAAHQPPKADQALGGTILPRFTLIGHTRPGTLEARRKRRFL